MKNSILILSLLISNLVFSQTSTVEADFRQTLDLIIKDAATGFRESKGNFKLKERWTNTTYHYSNNSFFNTKDEVFIAYHPYEYMPNTKVSIPESHYFYQFFSAKNPETTFVYDNVEQIFDEMIELKTLRKTIIKQDKQDKDAYKEIVYLDKNRKKTVSIFYDLKNKNCSINIYSEFRPSDLPVYNGCLIVYNVQLNSIVSANTYYVYGKDFKGEQYLYNTILSKMDATSQRLFSKYEWKPNAGTKQIFDLLKSLNVRENGHKVDVEGNLIN